MTKEHKEQVQYLLAQYTEGLASAPEEALLFQLLAEEKDDENWGPIVEELMLAENAVNAYDPAKWQPRIQSILATKPAANTGGKTRQLRTMYRVAASVIVLLGLALAGYLVFNKPDEKTESAAVPPKKDNIDIAPGGNKAVLTLADGSQIILDNAYNGTISQQGKTMVIKLDDGQLAYNTSGAGNEVLYNTISTPRGGQYQIVLPDGSKVWLNAASSLRFPTAFTGNERNVELTGEGYFEIAKNAAKPFHVKTGEMEVAVLGTHFNVKGYAEENNVKTTLLEGAVKIISKDKGQTFLKPGEQATQQKDKPSLLISRADLEHEVAWKNGLFDFDNQTMQDIMYQVARWYDVDVKYAGAAVNNHYTGSIRREVNISEVLQMLELAGGVQFSIEGKNVIIRGK